MKAMRWPLQTLRNYLIEKAVKPVALMPASLASMPGKITGIDASGFTSWTRCFAVMSPIQNPGIRISPHDSHPRVNLHNVLNTAIGTLLHGLDLGSIIDITDDSASALIDWIWSVSMSTGNEGEY
jgi:hypothetical protein